MPSARVSIRPLQVAAHPHNNSLVVLVHGILSSRYSAWEPAIDMIQEMYERGAKTATFGSFDYYAFGYQSTWRQPTFEDFFEPLRELVTRDRYDTVVLVGHSQGGLLAKLFLINEVRNGRGDKIKVDIVITLDTPHRGPQPWIYPIVMTGAAWKHLPVLRRVPVFRQASDLSFLAKNLRTLRTHWNSTLFPQTACVPQPDRRHVRSYTVSGTVLPFVRFKVVVSDKSARGLDIDQPLEIPASQRTAWGVGHGVAAMANYRFQIERLLSDHDFDGIQLIRKQLPATSRSDLIPLLASTCPPSALNCEVDSWLRRLVLGFGHRPLRKVTPGQAVKKFIALRLKHP